LTHFCAELVRSPIDTDDKGPTGRRTVALAEPRRHQFCKTGDVSEQRVWKDGRLNRKEREVRTQKVVGTGQTSDFSVRAARLMHGPRLKRPNDIFVTIHPSNSVKLLVE
jgi:hypothetical protein